MASDNNQASKKDLEKKRDSVKKQMNDCEDRIEDYDDKIRRLEKAKEKVEDLKEEFKKKVTKPDKATKNRRREWVGSNYDSFATKMEWVLSDDEVYYEDTLDYVLDELNNEIARLKKARNGDNDLWAKLKNAWIDLCNKIENWLN